MNTEDSKVVKYDENRNPASPIDKSRRSFAKVGVATPIIMTLASKTALGSTPYNCTVSGQQSGNLSSHPHKVSCKVGFSPGAWQSLVQGNGDLNTNGDGSLEDWLTAKVIPFSISSYRKKTVVTCEPNAPGSHGANTTKKTITISRESSIGDWEEISITEEYTKPEDCAADEKIVEVKGYFDSYSGEFIENAKVYKLIKDAGLGEQATLFNVLFQVSGDLGYPGKTVWEVFKSKGEQNIEFHVIADYLNAALNLVTHEFSPVYDDITPQYIIDAYKAGVSVEYFISLHH